MSLRTESDEDVGQSVLDLVEEWFVVPALLVVMGVMVRIRLLSYDNFVGSDGDVLFSGNDAWYHLREVNYTVRNWPTTMPFDPWTYFPYGTSVGQFGTLYDQLVATAALIVGLGSPSSELVAKTLLVAPAVFGALTAIPVYLLGRRMGGRLAGLFGAVVLALLPGLFLQRSLVGVADHNGVEPFFQAFAVVGMLAAIRVAERDLPIWELVAERDVDALRTPTIWAAAGGFAVAMYMWVWPPGVLLVGIVGVFTLLKVASDVRRGDSPEPVVYAIAVSMLVTALLLLVPLASFGFSPTQFSLVQPLAALGVAGGAVFLAALARQWEARGVDPDLYPVAVLGLVVVGFGLLAVLLPSLYNLISNNLLRIVGFSTGAGTRTIGEAQPYLDPNNLQRLGFVTESGSVDRIGRILADYGFTFFTAALAAVWMLAKPLYDEGESLHYGYIAGGVALVGLVFLVPAIPSGIGSVVGVNGQLAGLLLVAAVMAGAILLADVETSHVFVLVWAAFIASAAFTQLRFHYYLASVVAVLNAYLFAVAMGVVDLREVGDFLSGSIEGVGDALGAVEWHKIAAVVFAILVLVPVLMYPIGVRNTGNAAFDDSTTAWQTASGQQPGNIQNWDDSLQWLAANTPEEGKMGGAEGELDYYGTYERTEDFDYPDGTYGVQSWWDYGHWITLRAERIPNANPFQEGATPAANFLLAPNETAAEDVLADQSTEGNETRYVMVDYQMATPGSKFGAPVVFYDRGDVSQSTFYGPMYASRDSNYGTNFNLRTQRYYESQMIRLYEFHGSARDPSPVVVDWENERVSTGDGQQLTIRAAPPGNQSAVRQFPNVSAAREYVAQDGSAQVGGVGPFPSERVAALEHYRLVDVSNRSALRTGTIGRYINGASQVLGLRIGTYGQARQLLFANDPSWVKTFERVPGATIEGSNAPPNSNVTAIAQFRIPETNETFQYRQRAATDADGNFEMTLPYATTGYDEYGPDNGYTNVSVRSTTDAYTLRAPGGLNESGYVVQYGANLTVPEGQVNGAEDGTIEVALERRAQRLQIEQNVSASGSESVDVESGTFDPATGGATSDDGSTVAPATAPTARATDATAAPAVGR
jgi:dolichyl-diphosphooligosaccharide--protein glycosyltransferase